MFRQEPRLNIYCQLKPDLKSRVEHIKSIYAKEKSAESSPVYQC